MSEEGPNKRPARENESQAYQHVCQIDGNHHWAWRLRGGEPLSIQICMLCEDINWKQLREDFEKALVEKAGLPAKGTRTLCIGGSNHGKWASDFGDFYNHPGEKPMSVEVYWKHRLKASGPEGFEGERAFYIHTEMHKDEAVLRLRDMVFAAWIAGVPLEDR